MVRFLDVKARCAQDDAESRDRPGGLGDAEQRHVTALQEAESRPYRREGDQSPRRRGDVGI